MHRSFVIQEELPNRSRVRQAPATPPCPGGQGDRRAVGIHGYQWQSKPLPTPAPPTQPLHHIHIGRWSPGNFQPNLQPVLMGGGSRGRLATIPEAPVALETHLSGGAAEVSWPAWGSEQRGGEAHLLAVTTETQGESSSPSCPRLGRAWLAGPSQGGRWAWDGLPGGPVLCSACPSGPRVWS